MKLATAFRAGASFGNSSPIDDELLEKTLSALVERGRARWPSLPLDPELFASELGKRAPSIEALSTLAAEDVHLAVCCARRIDGALAAFDATCLNAGSNTGALRRIDPSPAFIDEVLQVVRERLFVPPPGRIAEYTGRGPLSAWTRVTTLRCALRLRPRHGELGQQSGIEQAATSDPELRLLQQRYGQQFEQALSASFKELDDEQHNLLRLQLVSGLRTAQIAALFGVDRSTIKRRLASCRELLLERTQAALHQSLGLSPQSFQSLARVLASQLNLSVARLLKQRD